MPKVGTRPVAVVDPQLAGTDYGQKSTGNAGVPDHVRQDLKLNHNAIREWNGVRRGIRKDIKSADNASRSQPRMGLKLAHRQNVSGLRRAIRSTATDVGRGLETRQMLRSGHIPNEYQNDARSEVERELPQLRKKLSLFCQFDRLAGDMRGNSGSDKVASTLSGLKQQAFNNVNTNLKDDLFLAKQNKLLSVGKYFPADGCGKVKSARSRELIRRNVAATLLQHGYAAAKKQKQDLTKYCELSERSGTNSAAAEHFRNKLGQAVDRINGGSIAADVHADMFGEFTGKTEQANLQAISKGDMNRLLDIPQDSQLADNQRNLMRDA